MGYNCLNVYNNTIQKDIPKIREGARRDPGMSNNEVMKLEEDKDLKGEFKELCKALRNNH